MGKGQSVPNDPLFYIAFIVLLFMSIAANVQEANTAAAKSGGKAPPANVGVIGDVSIAFSGAFDNIFGAGERKCLFLQDSNKNIDSAFPNGGTMANWQCVLIFGMIPFAILYYFMFDILSFTMISERTKNLVALAIAIFALQMHVLVNVTNFLAALTGKIVGGAFALFGLLIILGIAGSVLGQLGLTMRMAADASYGTGEVIYGIKTMRAVGKSISQHK